MTSVMVKAHGFKVPAMCVSCGAPVSPDWNPDHKASMHEAMSYRKEGNTTRTRKVRFPVCSTCSEARARIEARHTNYPGFWWTRSVGWLGIVVLIAWFINVQNAPDAPLTMDLFVAFAVMEAAAIVLGKILRRNNNKVNPADEADLARMTRLSQSVAVSPPDNSPLMRVTFANDAVGQAWEFANSAVGTSSVP